MNNASHKGQYIVRFKATCQTSSQTLLIGKTVVIDLTVEAFDYTFLLDDYSYLLNGERKVFPS